MKATRIFCILILTTLPTACDGAPPPPERSTAVPSPIALDSPDRQPSVEVSTLVNEIRAFEAQNPDDANRRQGKPPVVRWIRQPRGWLARVKYGNRTYDLLNRTMKVVRIVYHERVPWVEPNDEVGWTDPSKLRRTFVKVSEATALRNAKEFVEDHWGETILAGLRSDPVRSYFTGSRFSYSVSWAYAGRVELGLRRVSVEINPETGAVYEARVLDEKPPAEWEFDSEEVEAMISNLYEGTEGFRIDHMTLSNYCGARSAPGTSQEGPCWFVTCTFDCPEEVMRINPIMCPTGRGMVTYDVDANTGEVLEEGRVWGGGG